MPKTLKEYAEAAAERLNRSKSGRKPAETVKSKSLKKAENDSKKSSPNSRKK